MSQAGTLLGNAPVGAGILTVTGDNGLPVGPSILGDVEIVGIGDITVTGNPATNTLEISSAGLATQFRTDDGNDASPLAGVLVVSGAANQIQTLGLPLGGPFIGVGIALRNDVTIPNDLTVTNDLSVIGNSVITGDCIAQDITALGTLTSTGLCTTQAGITNTGALNSTGTLTVTDATLPSGVVQINAAHQFYSSNGANGTLLIGNPAAANPVWTNITSADASVGITNGPGTIDLAIGAIVPTRFNTNAGFAIPAARILTIANGTNTNTSAAGSTVQVNLNPSIALAGSLTAGTTISSTGLITAGNGLTVAAGNVSVTAGTLTTSGNITSSAGGISAAGTIVSHNLLGGFTSDAQAGSAAYYTVDGAIFSANGNISTTTGTISGRHIVATTDLVISPLNVSGVLYNTNAGLVQTLVGTPAQVMMASAGGPLWGDLAAGVGINLTYTAPNTITITNTGAGGVKAGFLIRLIHDLPNVTGDTTEIVFAGAGFLNTVYDTTGSFNLNTGVFTAPQTALYQFTLKVDVSYRLAADHYNQLSIITTPFGFAFNCPVDKTGALTTVSDEFVTNIYLTVGQTAYFKFRSSGTPLSKSCSIMGGQTFLSGFQVS
jgi:hypothetical protein